MCVAVSGNQCQAFNVRVPKHVSILASPARASVATSRLLGIAAFLLVGTGPAVSAEQRAIKLAITQQSWRQGKAPNLDLVN
jgi:hypothetical protein